MDYLKNTHDLRLPKWGPYSKKYMGISHIADDKKGVRFDLSVIPGFYRKKIDVPNVLRESGYHPWEASADLNYYCHRHELEWKDQVYCDISFSKITEDARLIRCECINNTDSVQNIVLHYMAYLNFPSAGSSIQTSEIKLPDNAIYIDALDYKDIEFAVKQPQDNLVFDATLRGEVRDHGFINGSGLGGRFGIEAENLVTYTLNAMTSMENGALLVRYRLEKGKLTVIKFKGIINKILEFNGTGEFQTITVPVGDIKQGGEYTLQLTSMGGDEIHIDGFVLVPVEQYGDVRFTRIQQNVYPEITKGPCKNSLILKYNGVDNCYGIKWSYEDFQIREFICEDLDCFMRDSVHNHVDEKLVGKGEGHYTDVFFRPICIKPGNTSVIHGMVCSGEKSEVENMLMKFSTLTTDCEEIYQTQRARKVSMAYNEQGLKYKFSQRLMSTTTLTNIVYPIYMKRSYIRHSTPGRCWNSLYTWDSGFIGLGLAEVDIERAIDSLNAYVTEPGDQHAAFIHHGSPVPVQHYLFLELWNRTQSKELLEFFYPRLRQYYLFLAGKLGSSTTRQFKSNILKTWDYFYNSGGWDDYPPQKYVHDKKLEGFVAPVVNTAQSIRTAKILRMAAAELGLKDDVEEYCGDIETFSGALQTYSWDEESGYFGYVVHDEEGNPTGVLRHESGANYNMGLDGVYPLVAGICSSSQKERLLEHLFSDGELWTKIGLSTVDQSAPYYREDGYWNGAVWMPHQWFIWKTLLDLGKLEDACRIAQTGLDLWKNEVDRSYNCFEHFIIKSGRGAGWHHFSGLSTPVLSWFSAYYRPGRLTCGFDIWIKKYQFSKDNCSLTSNLRLFGNAGNNPGIIAVMNPNFKYRVEWNGALLHFNEISKGVLSIQLPSFSGEGSLTVSAIAQGENINI